MADAGWLKRRPTRWLTSHPDSRGAWPVTFSTWQHGPRSANVRNVSSTMRARRRAHPAVCILPVPPLRRCGPLRAGFGDGISVCISPSGAAGLSTSLSRKLYSISLTMSRVSPRRRDRYSCTINLW